MTESELRKGCYLKKHVSDRPYFESHIHLNIDHLRPLWKWTFFVRLFLKSSILPFKLFELGFKSKKLGDRLSYSALRTVHMASLQVGENIGQNVALKMMQKQLISQSGGFPYLQMEKEVYFISSLQKVIKTWNWPKVVNGWLLNFFPKALIKPSATFTQYLWYRPFSTSDLPLSSAMWYLWLFLTVLNFQILKSCDSEFVPKLVATFETQNNYYLIQQYIS